MSPEQRSSEKPPPQKNWFRFPEDEPWQEQHRRELPAGKTPGTFPAGKTPGTFSNTGASSPLGKHPAPSPLGKHLAPSPGKTPGTFSRENTWHLPLPGKHLAPSPLGKHLAPSPGKHPREKHLAPSPGRTFPGPPVASRVQWHLPRAPRRVARTVLR